MDDLTKAIQERVAELDREIEAGSALVEFHERARRSCELELSRIRAMRKGLFRFLEAQEVTVDPSPVPF